MRLSSPLFVRLILRESVKHTKSTNQIIPELVPQVNEKKVVLIDELMKLKKSLGRSWPRNLRIEPVITKKTFARVHAEYRAELKGLLKER